MPADYPALGYLNDAHALHRLEIVLLDLRVFDDEVGVAVIGDLVDEVGIERIVGVKQGNDVLKPALPLGISRAYSNWHPLEQMRVPAKVGQILTCGKPVMQSFLIGIHVQILLIRLEGLFKPMQRQ